MLLPFFVVQGRDVARGRQQRQQAFKFFDLHVTLIGLLIELTKARAIGLWYCEEDAEADFTLSDDYNYVT